VNRARLLRKKTTNAERILWRHLRNRNFGGYKFRRQHPFDRYILIVRPQKWPSNWTVADITFVMDKFMIKRGRNS
jgi:hypothetical protein